MNILSLFDGISCGQVALERSGHKIDNYYASEIDKYAISVTQKNYPKTIQLGDIYDIDYDKINSIDLVMGGSPCTHWSIAKKNRETTSSGVGFDLFMQYVKAIEVLNPRYFLYENNHSIHKDIKDAISHQLGVQPIMINSSLVSAQNRKRCYWTNIPNVTLPEDRGIMLEDIVEPDALVDRDKSHAILASIGRTTHREYFKKHQGQMVYSSIMLSNIYGGFKETKPRVHLAKSVAIRTAAGGGHIPSLVINDKIKEFDVDSIKSIVRKVTPLECERLQTLPDGYTDILSDTQRYKGIGNGWTIDVIAHILNNISH